MNPLPSALPSAPPQRVSPFQRPTVEDIFASAPPAALQFHQSHLHPLITGEQLTDHLQTSPVPWLSLPGGQPLQLTAQGMEYVLDDFDGFDPASLRSAHVLLYFATRTPADMRALLLPPPLPRGDGAAPEEREPLALHIRTLMAEIGAWAASAFAPCAAQPVMDLAWQLWKNVVARMPVSAEKKNPATPAAPAAPLPDSASLSSGTCAGSSPEATPSGPQNSTPASPSGLFSTPLSVGPMNTSTGSLPIPKKPGASPPPGN